jgi:hypothetical protein
MTCIDLWLSRSTDIPSHPYSVMSAKINGSISINNESTKMSESDLEELSGKGLSSNACLVCIILCLDCIVWLPFSFFNGLRSLFFNTACHRNRTCEFSWPSIDRPVVSICQRLCQSRIRNFWETEALRGLSRPQSSRQDFWYARLVKAMFVSGDLAYGYFLLGLVVYCYTYWRIHEEENIKPQQNGIP